MLLHEELFDFSNYSFYRSSFTSANKKVPGLFKDELAGRPMDEIIGLRSKMYSFIVNEIQQNRASGVDKNKLRHEMYKNTLEKEETYLTDIHTMQSRRHNIETIKVNKISLTPYDDKRWVLDDGINTLAFGHYSIS